MQARRRQNVRGGRKGSGARSWAIGSLTTAVVLLLLATVLPAVGRAADEGRVITFGESLNPEQQEELRRYFKVAGDDEVLTITTDDTIKAMAGIYAPEQITSAYSSTALICRDLGDGLDVTTRNIDVVNPGLYAMALVTAGIGDATLVVAAPNDAPAQGMTALAGVFKSFDLAPCASGDTTKARQRLAIEELTLTVQIGQALEAAGTPNGVQVATTLVLETQKTIVTEKLSKEDAIDQAVAAQEQAAGVTIPDAERAELVDLNVRLAKEKIDWSTFSAGWQITWSQNFDRITMTGEGIAIRNARASATAEAQLAAELAARETAEAELAAERAAQQTAEAERAAEMTATARAERAAEKTATAEAQATEAAELAAQQTAEAERAAQLAAAMTAEAEAAAQMTAEARADMLATALAIPTATPLPVGVRGRVADSDGTWLSIVDDTGMTPSGAYAVDPAAAIVRDGAPAVLGALVQGDQAELVIDGSTGRVTRLVVTSAPVADAEDLRGMWGVALVGVLGLLILKRRRSGPPFVVRRR